MRQRAALDIDWQYAPFTRCIVDNRLLQMAPPDAVAQVPERSLRWCDGLSHSGVTFLVATFREKDRRILQERVTFQSPVARHTLGGAMPHPEGRIFPPAEAERSPTGTRTCGEPYNNHGVICSWDEHRRPRAPRQH
jgi:hypothetical protein